LVAVDTNGAAVDVFVHDMNTGATELVSVDSNGVQGSSGTEFDPPAITPDGRFVAFTSLSAHVPGDTNGTDDVFVRDRLMGTTEPWSAAWDGGEGNAPSRGPSISPDGRLVAFSSTASSLGANATGDAFVHDRLTGATEKLSVAPDGSPANGPAGANAISADGRV